MSFYSWSMFTLAILGGPIGAIAAAPPRPDAPILVVVAPWTDLGALVAAAGGVLIGPRIAPLGSLTSATHPDYITALGDQGAWLILDGALLANLCGVNS